MSETQSRLRLLTGEIGPGDPQTLGEAMARIADLEAEVRKLTTDSRSWHRRYDNLKADKEAEARRDQLWPRALAIFRYWQMLTGHQKANFGGERFWIVEPYLRSDGDAACRCAVRGLVGSDYHMKRGRYARRDGPIYDDFHRPFENRDKFERFRDDDPERDPTAAENALMMNARSFALLLIERIEERKEMVSSGDIVSVSHLLVEINKLITEWMKTPHTPYDAQPATMVGKPHPDDGG